MLRFFIAGVMQGSSDGEEVVEQCYRTTIREALSRVFPEADIYDPWAGHEESISYSDERGKRVFLEHNAMCGQVDVLIAFLPEASMGTAIEMWEAYRNGKKVISISRMRHNWAIKFISDHRYDSLEDFIQEVQDGAFQKRLDVLSHAG